MGALSVWLCFTQSVGVRVQGRTNSTSYSKFCHVRRKDVVSFPD